MRAKNLGKGGVDGGGARTFSLGVDPRVGDCEKACLPENAWGGVWGDGRVQGRRALEPSFRKKRGQCNERGQNSNGLHLEK